MREHDKKITNLEYQLSLDVSLDWSEIALCFGHFNVIHPGHLRYFQRAHAYGGRLVVAVEGDNVLSKVKRKEIYPEAERALAVAALEIVDQVIILNTGTLAKLIDLVKPCVLVLGREFERKQSIAIADAIARTVQHGGNVVYDAGETHYASADLFYGRQNEIEQDRWKKFQSVLESWNVDLVSMFSRLQEKRNPHLLVLGDTILDRYIACDPVGMSNEAPVVVVKELETKDFIGGAAIVAAHVAALRASCTYVSVVGDDEYAEKISIGLGESNVVADLFKDSSRHTTSKLRYMVENQKLFRVSRLKEHSLSRDLEDQFIDKIEKLAANLDGILVCDFVYGVITPRILEVLGRISQNNDIPIFGDLQCSSQVGNVAKFRDFHLLCPTEREARIALNNQNDGIEFVANELMEITQSSNLIVKLGADGFIAYGKKDGSEFMDRQHFPALSANPVDVTGAGDSLLAAVSVGICHGLTLMESAALGTCMSALAVQTVGNVPIRLEDLIEFIEQRGATINAR